MIDKLRIEYEDEYVKVFSAQSDININEMFDVIHTIHDFNCNQIIKQTEILCERKGGEDKPIEFTITNFREG